MSALSFLSLLALAVGLAMDATAVAAARGLAAPALRLSHFLLVGLLFGGFQAGMPFLGWLLGAAIGPSVVAWDHWIAFVLLAGLGIKMFVAALRHQEDEKPAEPFAPRTMIVLAIATSIDALAAGITLPMFDVPLSLSIATIGVTTAALSALGLALGRRIGARFGRRLDVFGGAVLVLLGVKILVEHLFA